MSNLREVFLAGVGATGKSILDNKPYYFFKKYESPSDFFIRSTSVVTAPIVFTGLSIWSLLNAGFYFLNAAVNLFTLNFSDAGENLKNVVGLGLVVSPLLLIPAVLSPLINLIDLIGSAITSIKHQATPEEFSTNSRLIGNNP